MPTYWILHPTELAFVSAHSPEGVGQVLMLADRWAAGRYLIREHLPGGSPATGGDRPWGYATKDGAGHIRIELDPAREGKSR